MIDARTRSQECSMECSPGKNYRLTYRHLSWTNQWSYHSMYPMWWLLNTSQNCKSKLESTPRKLWLESLRLLFTILGNELLLFDTRINDTCNCCRQKITFNWISCLSNMLYKVQISFYGACASSEKWNITKSLWKRTEIMKEMTEKLKFGNATEWNVNQFCLYADADCWTINDWDAA